MFTTKVILNPTAGGGRAGRRWPALRRALAGALPEGVDAVHTDEPGAATRLTREALRDGYDRIVAVGGDGTFNEVANGFFGDDDAPINESAVLVPVTCGTGGDFRRTTGAPSTPREATEALTGGRIRSIDAGRLTYTCAGGGRQRTRHFLNVASFGMGGAVDRRVRASPLPAWLGGRLTFFWAILHTMLTYRSQPVALSVGGRDAGHHHMRTVAVANGRYFGGGLNVAPDATLDDGQFDVVVLGDFSRLDFVRHIGRLYAGTHRSLEKVITFRGRTVAATSEEAEEAVLLDVDGEPLGRLPARFEVVPAALRLQA